MGISAETKINKEHQVFNEAIQLIKDQYWADITFAGRHNSTSVKMSGSAEKPYTSAEYQAVHQALSSSEIKQAAASGIQVHHEPQGSPHRCFDLECSHCFGDAVSCATISIAETIHRLSRAFYFTGYCP